MSMIHMPVIMTMKRQKMMHPQLCCELTFKVCASTALCLHASPTSHTRAGAQGVIKLH